MPMVFCFSSAWARPPAKSAAPITVTAAINDLRILFSSPKVFSLYATRRFPAASFPWLSRGSPTALPQDAVEPDRRDDDDADRHLLDRLRHVEHDQPVEQHAHDQRADDGVADAAAAAEQRGAADHG